VEQSTIVYSKRRALEGGGGPARKHILEQCEISTNDVVMLFDPARLVYEVKSSS
jgi:hypothetical protein